MPAFTKKDSTQTPDIMFSPTYDLLFENELCGHRSIGKACDMYKFFFFFCITNSNKNLFAITDTLKTIHYP